MQEETDFRDLIIKFLAGEISDSETGILKSWLQKDIANRKIFDKENELWQQSGIGTKPDIFKIDNSWKEISSKLSLGKKRVERVIILKRNNFRIFMAAAAIAFLVAIGGLVKWLPEREPQTEPVLATTIIHTDEGEKARIRLPDSSHVIMNSGSTLEYSTDYNKDKRIVKLAGEAYFDVRTNPDKPFIVEMEKMTVTATGTRFNVLSYGNESRIETTLEEGKIQVSLKDRSPVELIPGQQVVYFLNTDKTVVRDVVTETYTSWKENKLRLIDTPFEEALRRIARRYNVTFEIRSKELLDLKYTATLIDESIEDVMQMLKVVSPVTYRIYNRTSADDKEYLKPKIVVGKRKTIK